MDQLTSVIQFKYVTSKDGFIISLHENAALNLKMSDIIFAQFFF